MPDKAVCYVDVGSWEPYRSDAGQFPKRVLGRRFPGFPDERWLDVRKLSVLRPIMEKRFDTCAAKGFDAVEPDNEDGYDNNTGFPITPRQQLRYGVEAARLLDDPQALQPGRLAPDLPLDE